MDDSSNTRPEGAPGQTEQPEPQFQPPQPPQPPQEPSAPPNQQPYGYQPPNEGQPPPYPPYPQHTDYAPASGNQAPAPPSYGYGYGQPAPVEYKPSTTLRSLLPFSLVLLGLIVLSVFFFFGGEFATFAGVGLQIAPFAILAALAYAGVKNGVAAVFTYLWLAMLVFVMVLVDFLLVVGPFMNLNAPASEAFKPGVGQALLWMMLLLGVGGLVSAAMLLRPVRVLMARIMPIDPDNFVHKIALCMLTFLLFGLFTPLIALGGSPPLLELMNNEALQEASTGVSVRPQDLAYQFIWMIPAVLVAAGWPIVRNFKQTLVRLGMVRPTLVQVGAAIVLAAALAAFATFLLDPGITRLWEAMGWTTTDVEAFGEMMSKLITPLGAVLIGVVAGVSEEMAFRGLLQPRIGLIAANLLFTATHAFQYGFDALLSVFIIGLILGIIRARSNTTTAAIVHGVYDFILVFGSYLVGQQ